MTISNLSRYQVVRDYHERTKHHYHRMARSSGFMDWANQPDPFRRYAGCPIVPLPLSFSDPPLDYNTLYASAAPEPAPLTRSTVAAFLELSLGLSAWKAVGRDRWALRINPSSGNLHPTEAYLLLTHVDDLADGLYHYRPEDHALEQRMTLTLATSQALAAHFETPGFWVALSSIIWREAWKYGERAFRYCQHDIGHALAALGFSARLQGWHLTGLPDVPAEHLVQVLGFDRTDWHPREVEIPEVLVRVMPSTAKPQPLSLPEGFVRTVALQPLRGQPNQLSPEYRLWEVIQRVVRATRPEASTTAADHPPAAHPSSEPSLGREAAVVIRQRRSAVAFDFRGRMDRLHFFHMLARTQSAPDAPPFAAASGPPRISLLLFAHQVAELAPGMYMFTRHPRHRAILQSACDPDFLWQPVTTGLPLYLLKEGDFRATAADLACWQEIAGASVFALAMLAEFQSVIETAPWRYRQLFWEAGMIGQILYLEAEARGYRGTGIGCYFDDPVHDLIGIDDQSWQDLYHFTVGVPLEDSRLRTLPPYAHLNRVASDTRP